MWRLAASMARAEHLKCPPRPLPEGNGGQVIGGPGSHAAVTVPKLVVEDSRAAPVGVSWLHVLRFLFFDQWLRNAVQQCDGAELGELGSRRQPGSRPRHECRAARRIWPLAACRHRALPPPSMLNWSPQTPAKPCHEACGDGHRRRDTGRAPPVRPAPCADWRWPVDLMLRTLVFQAGCRQ